MEPRVGESSDEDSTDNENTYDDNMDDEGTEHLLQVIRR